MPPMQVIDAFEILQQEASVDVEMLKISEADQLLKDFSKITSDLLVKINELETVPPSENRQKTKEYLIAEVKDEIVLTQAAKTVRDFLSGGGEHWLN